MKYNYDENLTTEEEIEKAVVEIEEESINSNEYFSIGLHRRFYNKNLKDSIENSGMTYSQLKSKVNICKNTLSNIVNFKKNPSEKQRIQIAIALEIPIDYIFPEKYDEMYAQIAPLKKTAEIKIKMIALDNPEILKLRNNEDNEYFEKKADNCIFKTIFKKIKIFDCLKLRDKSIIKYRFGFDDNVPHTLNDTGIYFGITQERVRQIEAKILDKIRRTHPDLEKLLIA